MYLPDCLHRRLADERLQQAPVRAGHGDVPVKHRLTAGARGRGRRVPGRAAGAVAQLPALPRPKWVGLRG